MSLAPETISQKRKAKCVLAVTLVEELADVLQSLSASLGCFDTQNVNETNGSVEMQGNSFDSCPTELAAKRWLRLGLL